MNGTMRVGDVVTIERGTTYKSALIGQPGPVLLGLGTIRRHGGFRDDSLRTYGGESPEKLLVRPGQLYASLKDVTQTADLLGAVAKVPVGGPTGRLTQDTVRLDIVPSTVDPDYLYWMLRTPQYRDYCRSHATGTTTMGLPREDFFAFEFPAPAPARQVLVELFGALDDKIAANETEVASAEALIVALVGRAQGTTRLAELARQSTRSVRTSEFADSVAHFSLPAFDAAALPEIAAGATIKSNKFLLDVPCVLVSKLNPRIPRIWDVRALPEQMSVASTEFVVLVPQGDSTTVLWAALSDPRVSTELSGLVAGTSGSHQRVKPSEMLQVEVPDTRTLSTTTREAISSLGTLAHGRRIESQRLAATRDELLPLLMSGNIRVKDAEMATEGVL